MSSKATSQTFDIGGVHVRVLQDGFNATPISFDLFEVTMQKKGLGPGPHYHQEMQESFYVISGQVRFVIDGKEIIARQGDFLTAPKTIVHQWSSAVDEETKMLLFFSPSKNQIEYFAGLEKIQGGGKTWGEAINELSIRFDNHPA